MNWILLLLIVQTSSKNCAAPIDLLHSNGTGGPIFDNVNNSAASFSDETNNLTEKWENFLISTESILSTTLFNEFPNANSHTNSEELNNFAQEGKDMKELHHQEDELLFTTQNTQKIVSKVENNNFLNTPEYISSTSEKEFDPRVTEVIKTSDKSTNNISSFLSKGETDNNYTIVSINKNKVKLHEKNTQQHLNINSEKTNHQYDDEQNKSSLETGAVPSTNVNTIAFFNGNVNKAEASTHLNLIEMSDLPSNLKEPENLSITEAVQIDSPLVLSVEKSAVETVISTTEYSSNEMNSSTTIRPKNVTLLKTDTVESIHEHLRNLNEQTIEKVDIEVGAKPISLSVSYKNSATFTVPVTHKNEIEDTSRSSRGLFDNSAERIAKQDITVLLPFKKYMTDINQTINEKGTTPYVEESSSITPDLQQSVDYFIRHGVANGPSILKVTEEEHPATENFSRSKTSQTTSEAVSPIHFISEHIPNQPFAFEKIPEYSTQIVRNLNFLSESSTEQQISANTQINTENSNQTDNYSVDEENYDFKNPEATISDNNFSQMEDNLQGIVTTTSLSSTSSFKESGTQPSPENFYETITTLIITEQQNTQESTLNNHTKNFRVFEEEDKLNEFSHTESQALHKYSNEININDNEMKKKTQTEETVSHMQATERSFLENKTEISAITQQPEIATHIEKIILDQTPKALEKQLIKSKTTTIRTNTPEHTVAKNNQQSFDTAERNNDLNENSSTMYGLVDDNACTTTSYPTTQETTTRFDHMATVKQTINSQKTSTKLPELTTARNELLFETAEENANLSEKSSTIYELLNDKAHNTTSYPTLKETTTSVQLVGEETRTKEEEYATSIEINQDEASETHTDKVAASTLLEGVIPSPQKFFENTEITNNSFEKGRGEYYNVFETVNEKVQEADTSRSDLQQQTAVTKPDYELVVENTASVKPHRPGVIKQKFFYKFADSSERNLKDISVMERELQFPDLRESSLTTVLTTETPFDVEDTSIMQNDANKDTVTPTAEISIRDALFTGRAESATTKSISPITSKPTLIRLPLERNTNSFSITNIQPFNNSTQDVEERQDFLQTTQPAEVWEETTTLSSIQSSVKEVVTFTEYTDAITSTQAFEKETEEPPTTLRQQYILTQTSYIKEEQQQIQSTTVDSAQTQTAAPSEESKDQHTTEAEEEINSSALMKEHKTTVMPAESEQSANLLSSPPPKLEYLQSDDGVEVFFGYSIVKRN